MWPGTRNVRLSIAKHDLLVEVIVRVVLLLAVCILQLCIKPHKRYITEVDLLKHYKRPRRHSLVPAWATVTIVIVIPLLCFAAPEYMARNSVNITHAFLSWTLALALNGFVTEIIKLISGRPRPDFFYRCYPDGNMQRELIYIPDTKDVLDGRKSFPSGHSSFTFCSMGFVSIWLCGRLGALSPRPRHLFKRIRLLLTCIAPLGIACGVAISRILDNHHHWEDVVVGSLIGLLISYLSYIQYFHPLYTELCGRPLLEKYRIRLLDSYESSQTECSTKYLSK